MSRASLSLHRRSGDALGVARGLTFHAWRKTRYGVVLSLANLVLLWLLLGAVTGPGEGVATGMLVYISAVFAFQTGVGFGQLDSKDGVEEFVLCLPPTRRERYFINLGSALTLSLTIFMFGALAVATSWPYWLMDQLGWTARFAEDAFSFLPAGVSPGLMTFTGAMTVGMAAIAYAWTAGVQPERGSSWISASLTTLAALGLGVALELMAFGAFEGWIAALLMLVAGGVAAYLGRQAYERRDASFIARPADDTRQKKLLTAAMLIGLLLLGVAVALYVSGR